MSTRRPRFHRGLFLASIPLLLVALMANTCGGYTPTAAFEAPDLQVSIVIMDHQNGQFQPAPTSYIAVHFANQGNTVLFTHSETIVCGGVSLRYDEQLIGPSSYIGDMPAQPAGGVYTCVFTSSTARKTTINIPAVILSTLAITAPASGNTVTIPTGSLTFTIAYTPSGIPHASVTMNASGSGNGTPTSAGSATFTGPDTGTLSVPASAFHGFTPGPGSIQLSLTASGLVANTGFQEVTYQYQTQPASIPVSWVS